MATLGDQRLPESFWAKVKLTESGCWEWTGAVATNGYARLSLMPWGKARTAHRIAYEVLAGPIPTGLDLDHLCRVPKEEEPRSEAWTLGDGSVVVLVEGKSGGVCLSHIEVRHG